MVAISICWISASPARQIPEPTRPAANNRRRDSPENSRGANPMPSARPPKTAPNSTPYPGSPASRSSTYVRPRPITTAPAANAPEMPTTRPRTTGVPVT